MGKVDAADKTATTKAMEYYFDKEIRLYEDKYSKEFVSTGNRILLSMLKFKPLFNLMVNYMEKLVPGVYGGLACRMHYMDYITKQCVSEGFEAVINLGAGFDTRPFRIDELNDIPYYIMDLPETIDSYKETVNKKSLPLPKSVKLVPIDFNSQSVEKRLKESGYIKTKKTLFIWEGVTQYITRKAIDLTLEFVAKTSKGSRIAFSYVLSEAIEHPEKFPSIAKTFEKIKNMQTPWISGFKREEIESFLSDFGLKLVDDIGRDYHIEKILKPLNRELEVMNIERIVLAEKI